MAGIAVVATGVGLFAQDSSPRGSQQDGAHRVTGSPSVRPRGVDGADATSAESETSRAPMPANRESSGKSLVVTGREADDREAVRFRKAAAQEDADDDREAMQWYLRAAEQGDAEAQYTLGLAYSIGRGVAEDDREAVQWFREAAEQGHAKAQFGLGAAYASGRGVIEDDREAVQWYRKAAEQGYAEAQLRLGVLYTYSEGGVLEDYVQAYAWINLAAAQGHETATEIRPLLRRDMTHAQIAEAQKLSLELAD